MKFTLRWVVERILTVRRRRLTTVLVERFRVGEGAIGRLRLTPAPWLKHRASKETPLKGTPNDF
jgi:hypothetical protein